VRFAGHVFPGETLRIEAWNQEGGSAGGGGAGGGGVKILFRATTAERGAAVLTHAALRLRPRQDSSKL